MSSKPVKFIRRWASLLSAAVLVALAPIVFGTQAAHADAVNPIYLTPGFHDNGRQWFTTCEKYTAKITRCRTEIYATVVVGGPGTYKRMNGWVFNNLTYFGGTRADWGNNNLAHSTTWHDSNNRRWFTACETSGICKTFVETSFVQAFPRSDGSWGFRRVYDDVFNNQVIFPL